MTKICRLCNIEKNLEFYHKRPTSKDGRRTECIECIKAKQKIYRNSEGGKEARKRGYEKFKNSEKGKWYREVYRKQYYLSDHGRAMNRKYKNSEKGKATKRSYNHRPEIVERRRELGRRPEVIAKRKVYMQTENFKDSQRRKRKEYREIGRDKVYRLVHKFIGAGLLTKQPCAVCGDECAHAHHDNYEKPLDVVWLCPTHHREHHAKQGA